MRCLPIAIAFLVSNGEGAWIGTPPRSVRLKESALYNSYLDQLSAYSAYQHGKRAEDDDGSNADQETSALPIATPAEGVSVNEEPETPPAPVTPTISTPAIPAVPAPFVVEGLEPFPEVNGWVPDPGQPLYGLPGAIPPLGYWDPLGFGLSEECTINTAKLMREAEVTHGRVAMLAVLGYATGENFEGPYHLTGPAIHQADQLPPSAFAIISAFVTALELYRAQYGWKFPDVRRPSKTLFTLKETYYPGDIGFDPWRFKPVNDAFGFDELAAKELSNGRLAMIAITLMTIQELTTGKPIFS